MKKLSINKMNEYPVIDEPESQRIIGGTSAFGWQEYYDEYGSYPPSDTGYDPATDTCYSITDNVSSNYPPGTETIGESDYDRYNRMNDFYGGNGGPYQGPITQTIVRWINGW